MKPYRYYYLTIIPLVLTLVGILMLSPFGVALSPAAKFFAVFIVAIVALQGVPAALAISRVIKRIAGKINAAKPKPLSQESGDRSYMNRLLIVDQNAEERAKIEAFFSSSPVEVEATASAAYAIAQVARQQESIVILGDMFEEEITAPEVVALMRRCNRNLPIILVSDESFLETLHHIRKAGVLSCEQGGHNSKGKKELRHIVESAVDVFSRQCPNL